MSARWRGVAWAMGLWAAGVAATGAVAFIFKLLMLGAVRI
ncbi:DUF2474 family protein [Bordetella sp. N]|nr:DUF2474 family protein [Bordetella sp. N]